MQNISSIYDSFLTTWLYSLGIYSIYFISSSWAIYCGNKFYNNTRTNYDAGFNLLSIFSFLISLFYLIPLSLWLIHYMIIGTFIIRTIIVLNVLFGVLLSLRMKDKFLIKFNRIRTLDAGTAILMYYVQFILMIILNPLAVIIMNLIFNIFKLTSYSTSYKNFMNGEEYES